MSVFLATFWALDLKKDPSFTQSCCHYLQEVHSVNPHSVTREHRCETGVLGFFVCDLCEFTFVWLFSKGILYMLQSSEVLLVFEKVCLFINGG